MFAPLFKEDFNRPSHHAVVPLMIKITEVMVNLLRDTTAKAFKSSVPEQGRGEGRQVIF
jgi:hypothetical protein